MQIVENWAYLIGIIISALPVADQPELYELHVKVETIEKVEGFPTLVENGPDGIIVVKARKAQIEDPDKARGQLIEARVRAAGPQPLRYFVAPDWSISGD